TGTVRKLTTDDQGRYSASSLQIGNYQVRATKEGFATQTQQGLVLTIGAILPVNFRLGVGQVTTQVEVEGAANAQVNTTTSEVGGLIGASQMTDLPLNG